MIDFVGLLILLVLVVLFGFLVKRAWGSKRKWLKWVGLILSGLLTLMVAAVLVLAIIGTLKLNQNYDADHPVANIKATASPEKLAWASKYVLFCAECHSPNGQLPLAGRDFFAPAPGAGGGGAPPIGTLYARNLTPGGELKDWSDGEVMRALREGVHKSGRSLMIMPSIDFHNLSDEDAQAVVAYLRAQPAITPDAPPNSYNVVGAILVATIFGGESSVQPHITQPVVAPPQGPTREWGQYLIAISGCRLCHGENLAGGEAGRGAWAPNLTAFVPKWSESDFTKTIRTGIDPTGHQLSDIMPWKTFSGYMSDDDLKGIYTHLHGLPMLPDNPRDR